MAKFDIIPENQIIKLFLVSKFQILAKANREPEENLNERHKADPQTKTREAIEV